MDENPKAGSNRTARLRTGIALLLLTLFATAVVARLFPHPKPAALCQAQWQAVGRDGYQISDGSEEVFHFDESGNRVVVSDAPAFHFSTNQDFSVEAWIRAYPVYSRTAQWLIGWIGGYPKLAQLTPKAFAGWLSKHSLDNEFGVTPVVDKHLTTYTIESVGFQLYLDSGRLACQLSAAPMRQLTFQNFVSPGPNLQDGRRHHVALSVVRDGPNGGKLFVDGRLVYGFDPTRQNGDLSNVVPLRIGNHSNPGLRCRFKGEIGKVVLYRHAFSAQELATNFKSGHP